MAKSIEITHPACRTALACVADWRESQSRLTDAQARVDELYECYAGDEDEPAELTPEQQAEVETLADRLGIGRLRASEVSARALMLTAYEDFVRACGATEAQIEEFRDVRRGRELTMAHRVAEIVTSEIARVA